MDFRVGYGGPRREIESHWGAQCACGCLQWKTGLGGGVGGGQGLSVLRS